jgi:hypothetical protein
MSANSHRNLILPSNTSETHAMANALRAHHNAMHGDVAEIAAYLMKVLPGVIEERGGARRGFGGMDAKLSARRVVHPLKEIASLNMDQARLWVTFYTGYQHRVVNISSKSGTGNFNADL